MPCLHRRPSDSPLAGSPHIPYRNSRLTRILQTSLGGNSRTLICVCVTVGKKNTHETISTLKFAGLAKTITNRFNVNVEADVKPKVYPAFATCMTRLSDRRADENVDRDLRQYADDGQPAGRPPVRERQSSRYAATR